MSSASNSITINRAPADVFAYLADGLNGPKWRPGVLDIAHASGQGVGAVYRQGVKGPGGRRIDADYEITAYEPPRHLAFKAIAGPVRPTGEYRLGAAGDGTKLTFSLAAELTGIKKLLMGGAVQSTMDAEVANLSRLKAALEG
ncbi:MAG TPA: SRPBCC family protein [Candidatus Limnocylindrales bacterium]|nr:SRPBCC family protein [Candidatus Limnocylindrales bacterium]